MTKKKAANLTKEELEKVEEIASSKIEHTKTHTLFEYRKNIKKMSDDIKEYALKLCPDNLLSVKMALMNAVRLIEEMMRERRE